MTEKLRPEYEKELEDMRLRMLDAQAFAEKFPAFSDQILSSKMHAGFTGSIAHTYKKMYFGWGINRKHCASRDSVMNYRGEDFSPCYLWYVYINQISLFGDYYTDTGLYSIKDNVPVFFFDASNTTFYATDDQIMAVLDAICDWYEKAKVLNDTYRKEEKKKELLKELEKLERQ